MRWLFLIGSCCLVLLNEDGKCRLTRKLYTMFQSFQMTCLHPSVFLKSRLRSVTLIDIISSFGIVLQDTMGV